MNATVPVPLVAMKTLSLAPAIPPRRVASVRSCARRQAKRDSRWWTPYRRDLAVGMAVSVLVHAWIFFGTAFRPPAAPAPVTVFDEPPRLALIAFSSPELEDAEPSSGEVGETRPDIGPPPRLPEPPMVAALDPSAFVVPATRLPATLGTVATAALAVAPPAGNGVGARFTGIFELAELDQPPEVRAQALPQYPPELQRVGLAGEVVVRFVVDAQGAVCRARVVRSSRAEFERPALRAVAQWRFRAGRKAGRPVATWMDVPIAFAMPDRR